MNFRTSGGAFGSLPVGTPTSCSQSFEPSIKLKPRGGLVTCCFQSGIVTVAVISYRPGWFKAKKGARSTRLMATLEDSKTNSPPSGASAILETTRPSLELILNVNQSSSAPKCNGRPERLVI